MGGLASLLALAYGPFVQNLLVIKIGYLDDGSGALLSFSRDYHYNNKKNLGMAPYYCYLGSRTPADMIQLSTVS